eukprot:960542_1
MSQTCSEPYQCSLSKGDIQIKGYKAAIGSSFLGTNDSRIWCEGAFSCQGMSSIISERSVQCKSTHACSNTSIQVANNDRIWVIFCLGLHSCSSSLLSVPNGKALIHCDGVQSCAFSRINAMNVLSASGAHALYSSVIHSSNDLTVELRGKLAGHGGALTCHSGHTCTINCHTFDSCYMFYIDCIGNCDINAHQNIAPNISHNITNTDHICNTHPNATTYDRLNEQQDSDVENGGPMCCRAGASCKRASITSLSVTTEATEAVICSGAFSCELSNIHANNGSVFCEAADSCFDSSIYNASGLYCLG